MANNEVIRRATAEDAPALAALVRGLERFDWLREEPLAQTVERVARLLALCLADDSHSVYVAEQDGVLLGYLAVHWSPYLILRGPEGFVSELFLAAEARGRGAGSRLLETAVAEARARGCARLSLLNNRHRDSYHHGFYANRGWTERADMANFVLYLE